MHSMFPVFNEHLHRHEAACRRQTHCEVVLGCRLVLVHPLLNSKRLNRHDEYPIAGRSVRRICQARGAMEVVEYKLSAGGDCVVNNVLPRCLLLA